MELRYTMENYGTIKKLSYYGQSYESIEKAMLLYREQ